MTNLYLDIPTFNDFTKVLDGSVYHELPDDWWVGTSDIVGSTKAVAQGRFKDVNMVGASVICAVSNALGHSDYPFMFGGDGASFACPPEKIEQVVSNKSYFKSINYKNTNRIDKIKGKREL